MIRYPVIEKWDDFHSRYRYNTSTPVNYLHLCEKVPLLVGVFILQQRPVFGTSVNLIFLLSNVEVDRIDQIEALPIYLLIYYIILDIRQCAVFTGMQNLLYTVFYTFLHLLNAVFAWIIDLCMDLVYVDALCFHPFGCSIYLIDHHCTFQIC